MNACRRPLAAARSCRAHATPPPNGSNWKSSPRTAAPPHGSSCLPREPPKPPACANPPTKAPSRAASDSARPKNHIFSALGTPTTNQFNPAGNRSKIRPSKSLSVPRRSGLGRGLVPTGHEACTRYSHRQLAEIARNPRVVANMQDEPRVWRECLAAKLRHGEADVLRISISLRSRHCCSSAMLREPASAATPSMIICCTGAVSRGAPRSSIQL